jgi:hypothetical protein
MAVFRCVPVRGHVLEKGEAVGYFAGCNDISLNIYIYMCVFLYSSYKVQLTQIPLTRCTV